MVNTTLPDPARLPEDINVVLASRLNVKDRIPRPSEVPYRSNGENPKVAM